MLNFGNKEFRNLQEQVLKNAQDIETLKGREDLQIVIVNELPEVGNPNYIYLVAKDDGESPDVYDEYIWLEDEERYEKIGGVTIDLTNYVTLDSEQTITANKTLDGNLTVTGTSYIKNINPGSGQSLNIGNDSGVINFACVIRPIYSYSDVGTSSNKWRNLFLSNSLQIVNTNDLGIKLEPSLDGIIYVKVSNNAGTNWYNACVFDNYRIKTYTIQPLVNNSYTVGTSTLIYATVYTAELGDGVNLVTVANIASKVTSTFISGTFDSNGESTIDTEQAGTPEGLFIFTYGNCQCFLRLTAAMVNSADVTPIRVAIPMIYNSDPVNGWLNITKAGSILILKITDGTNHVDSGYGWILTKTNLI